MYPDLESVMRSSSLRQLPAKSKYSPSPPTGVVYRDIDSIVCTFCGHCCHDEQNCHRKEKIMKKIAQRPPLGASADIQPQHFTKFVSVVGQRKYIQARHCAEL